MRNFPFLILLFFAGDSSITKKEFLEAIKNPRKIWPLVGLISMLILIVVGALYGTFRQSTSFNVSVITEEFKVETWDTPMSPWPVNNIEVSKTCPDDPDDIIYENFSGTIKIHPKVQIVFTRIAMGDLMVKFHNKTDEPSGELYDDEDEPAGLLSDCSFFYVKDIAKRAEKGETVILPITGSIVVGKELRFLTHYLTPVLYSGQITILDKAFLIDEYYSVGPFTLEMGDSFVIRDQMVASQGFASINNNPAIHLVFRAKGSHGLIQRYQSESYVLRNSLWSKLYQDEALSFVWMVALLLIGFIRTYLRYMVE